ncbi:hypothetical protein BH11PSE11_BH11PSE11_16890 [soil metagenome]
MTIRFEGIKTFRLLAFVALGVLATSAFAQSAEYRRGYDAGYRDGLSARGGEGRGESRRESPRIGILSARYGSREGSCDASDTIRRMAGWNRHVEFTVNNDLCGDPDEGRRKRLNVEYRCGDGSRQRSEAGEGSIMSLSCQ